MGVALTACLRRSVRQVRVWEADGAAVHRKLARLLRELVPAKSGRRHLLGCLCDIGQAILATVQAAYF